MSMDPTEMDELLGARKGERTGERSGYRSGYYSRGGVDPISSDR